MSFNYFSKKQPTANDQNKVESEQVAAKKQVQGPPPADVQTKSAPESTTPDKE